jgi:hypothetical protein
MSEELKLYETDRPAWIAQSAPRLALRIAEGDESSLNRSWSCMGRDYQTATWQHLDEVQRDRIRKLRGTR